MLERDGRERLTVTVIGEQQAEHGGRSSGAHVLTVATNPDYRGRPDQRTLRYESYPSQQVDRHTRIHQLLQVVKTGHKHEIKRRKERVKLTATSSSFSFFFLFCLRTVADKLFFIY